MINISLTQEQIDDLRFSNVDLESFIVSMIRDYIIENYKIKLDENDYIFIFLNAEKIKDISKFDIEPIVKPIVRKKKFNKLFNGI